MSGDIAISQKIQGGGFFQSLEDPAKRKAVARVALIVCTLFALCLVPGGIGLAGNSLGSTWIGKMITSLTFKGALSMTVIGGIAGALDFGVFVWLVIEHLLGFIRPVAFELDRRDSIDKYLDEVVDESTVTSVDPAKVYRLKLPQNSFAILKDTSDFYLIVHHLEPITQLDLLIADRPYLLQHYKRDNHTIIHYAGYLNTFEKIKEVTEVCKDDFREQNIVPTSPIGSID